MKKITIRAYSDGACDRDQRRMHIGYYAEDKSGQVLFCGNKPVTNSDGDQIEGTCNKSELYAIINLISELDKYIEANPDAEYDVTLHTDSMLSYHQIKGFWKINSDELFDLVAVIREKMQSRGWDIKHIPRKENAMADSLSDEGVVEELGGSANSVDFSRTKTSAVSGGRLISHDTLKHIFSPEIPLFRDQILAAMEKKCMDVALSAIDSIISLLTDAQSKKITAYLDKQIKTVTDGVIYDLTEIKKLILCEDIESAKELLSLYTFKVNTDATEEIIYDPTEQPLDEIEEYA